MLEVKPPDLPSIAKIWKTTDRVVFFTRAPRHKGDRIDLVRDGVGRRAIELSRPGLGLDLVGVKELRLNVYRNGQIISTDVKLLDGGSPPDPDDEPLIELRARRDKINAELHMSAARTVELQTELAAVQAEIHELEGP
jgi:hypothetical protein